MNQSDHDKIRIIPLGGLEQIGMNMTAFEYGDSILVVDCGLSFPTDDMLGIDLVIPDVTWLEENIDRVKGFFITHGHEDHIGALPYILNQIPVPVYGTGMTIGIIESKLKEYPVPKSAKRKVVRYGQTVSVGSMKVEFIRVNHSIVDAAALAIHTPLGILVHSGDFKVDYTPVFGEPMDLSRFSELGKKGVLALLCESTNIYRDGFTMSERTVGKTFDTIFAENMENRIIVATFASNVDRVQQVINSACRYGRKVVIDGRSMVNIMTTAQEMGYIQIPEGCLINIEELKQYPREKTVVITTGSQGEAMASLSRMAANIHRKVSVGIGDTVIISATPIPGNEKAVSKVINDLTILGARVIFQDTHVSGHACREEIKLLYSLVRPKFAIPIHGEYRHLAHHAELAQGLGIPKENIYILHSGDVLEMDEDSASLVGMVPAGSVLVDGLGIGDVGNAVLRDRQSLSQQGIVVVVVVMDPETHQLISGPEIQTRGFVYVKESEELLEELRSVALGVLWDCEDRGISDENRIRNRIRDDMGEYLWKRMKRSPVILPIIMEA